jgi:hypothetical protein
MVQACQSWRTVYVAHEGSVVTNHLHDWGLVPPVTVALREIGVPRGWGLAGVAVTPEMAGAAIARPIVFL